MEFVELVCILLGYFDSCLYLSCLCFEWFLEVFGVLVMLRMLWHVGRFQLMSCFEVVDHLYPPHYQLFLQDFGTCFLWGFVLDQPFVFVYCPVQRL